VLSLALCTRTVQHVIDAFFLGTGALACWGVPLFVQEQLAEMDNQGRGAGFRNELLRRLGGVAVQVLAWSSGGVLGRLMLFFGGFLACKNVYSVMLVEGRRLSMMMGETIEEPFGGR
jgi:hypothetical protein